MCSSVAVLEKQNCSANVGKSLKALGTQEQIIPARGFSHVLHCFKLCVAVPRLEEDGVKYYSLFLLCTNRTFYEIYSLQHAVDIDTLFSLNFM